MENYLLEGALNYLHDIGGFQSLKNVKITTGHVINSAHSSDLCSNVHHTTHGGFIMALVDTTASMAGFTEGKLGVTLNASFNFIKSIPIDTDFLIDSRIIHNGRTTQIIETTICSPNREILYATASLTSFVIKLITSNDDLPSATEIQYIKQS